MQRGLPERRKIKDVAKVIAVSSAKGGVGKSTIAANLALSFARLGHRSGILDTDIFGPSIPTLFNLNEEPRLSANNQLLSLSNYGVKTMSMGYLVGEDAPVVWRGMMVMKALQQLLHEVHWGGLDVLVLDLPPGTGDTQLSITQQIVLDGKLSHTSFPARNTARKSEHSPATHTGSVIVTTPHSLSVKDAVKGINMFKKVNVPLLGLVNNMSLFTCPDCGSNHHIFGSSDGVQKVCTEQDIAFLGDIPLHQNIGSHAQEGKPTVVAEPESVRAEVFLGIARELGGKIGL
ncbi:hypothetical protein Daus18300_006418 [Diaporthe australafricana]|uniref:Cytosolic Fe-S cluster assembling factor NBP35 n=1 Tax=Diaporthe australafricana TaxID=127596 RepID=A0ABR3WUY8_9PEZI